MRLDLVSPQLPAAALHVSLRSFHIHTALFYLQTKRSPLCTYSGWRMTIPARSEHGCQPRIARLLFWSSPPLSLHLPCFIRPDNGDGDEADDGNRGRKRPTDRLADWASRPPPRKTRSRRETPPLSHSASGVVCCVPARVLACAPCGRAWHRYVSFCCSPEQKNLLLPAAAIAAFLRRPIVRGLETLLVS